MPLIRGKNVLQNGRGVMKNGWLLPLQNDKLPVDEYTPQLCYEIQQPLNDAQMLAAWLLSIKGAHNWDCIAMAW